MPRGEAYGPETRLFVMGLHDSAALDPVAAEVASLRPRKFRAETIPH